MAEKKAFWKSTGFWGPVAAVLIEGLEKFAVIPGGTGVSVIQLLSVAVGIFGRVRATKPLGLTG